MSFDVVVVGGAGHVGLPLALLLAESSRRKVAILDTNEQAIEKIKHGEMPFMEEGGQELLRLVLPNLAFTSWRSLNSVHTAIVCVGTPMKSEGPDLSAVFACVYALLDSKTSLIVIRSTLPPGTMKRLQKVVGSKSMLAYCPERVVQGRAIEEIRALPQIVGAYDMEKSGMEAALLFQNISSSTIYLTPEEAEYAKLLCNAYRYIKFAVANQFHSMLHEDGIDYEKVRRAVTEQYPRMDLPSAGFAAGPCLQKDTEFLVNSQRKAVDSPTFSIQALAVNGMVPYQIRDFLWENYFVGKTIGLLGMAFKANSDDRRDSLSYMLKNLLIASTFKVLTTDPYVKDSELVDLQTVLSESDVLVLCVPHSDYKGLRDKVTNKFVVDLWGLWR